MLPRLPPIRRAFHTGGTGESADEEVPLPCPHGVVGLAGVAETAAPQAARLSPPQPPDTTRVEGVCGAVPGRTRREEQRGERLVFQAEKLPFERRRSLRPHGAGAPEEHEDERPHHLAGGGNARRRDGACHRRMVRVCVCTSGGRPAAVTAARTKYAPGARAAPAVRGTAW